MSSGATYITKRAAEVSPGDTIVEIVGETIDPPAVISGVVAHLSPTGGGRVWLAEDGPRGFTPDPDDPVVCLLGDLPEVTEFLAEETKPPAQLTPRSLMALLLTTPAEFLDRPLLMADNGWWNYVSDYELPNADGDGLSLPTLFPGDEFDSRDL